MPPVNIPITQVWPDGILNTDGIQWITAEDNVDTPQPINSTIGITFNSGSQTSLNNITIFMRGTSDVPVLQGVINNQFVNTLNGWQLTNNDTLPPGLRANPEPYAFNIQVSIQWGNYTGDILGYQISLQNSFNPTIYQYNSLVSSDILNVTHLTNNTNYLFWAELEDDMIEVMIYPFDTQNYLDAPIFASAPIVDTSVFYRLSGAIGISVDNIDTDALVYSLRPYHTVFAAFESNNFNSRTPVIGAQLYAQNTPPTQLFFPPLEGLTSSDDITPTITGDSGRTLSGESLRIVFGASDATATYQGCITQPLTPIGDNLSGIIDYTALNASFDIWIESSALISSSDPFIGLLVNEYGYGIPLLLPSIIPNKWNHGVVNLLANSNTVPIILTEDVNTVLSSPIPINSLIPSGLYKFAVLYTGSTATTVWLDNVQITSNAVSWYGRINQNDPFTQDLFTWIPFNNTIDTPNDGIRFDQPGYSLQIKAEALQQASEIYNGYTLVPRYADLGRFVMDKTIPDIIPTSDGTSPGINVSTPTSLGDYTYSFSCDIIDPTENIYNITWSFGDGNYAFDQWISGTSPVVRTYQYHPGSPNFGQYYVTANVTDNFNNKGYGTTFLSL